MACNKKNLTKHMCGLAALGMQDCIESLSDNPVIECKYCGAKANSIKNICAALFVVKAKVSESHHASANLGKCGKFKAEPKS